MTNKVKKFKAKTILMILTGCNISSYSMVNLDNSSHPNATTSLQTTQSVSKLESNIEYQIGRNEIIEGEIVGLEILDEEVSSPLFPTFEDEVVKVDSNKDENIANHNEDIPDTKIEVSKEECANILREIYRCLNNFSSLVVDDRDEAAINEGDEVAINDILAAGSFTYNCTTYSITSEGDVLPIEVRTTLIVRSD